MTKRSVATIGGLVIAAAAVALTVVFVRDSRSTQSLGLRQPASPAADECDIPGGAPHSLATSIGACRLQTLAQPRPSTPLPTPKHTPVTSFEEAFRVAGPLLVRAGDVYDRSELESVVYIETTVGTAREFFTPDRRIHPDIADDVAAWVFVAYGVFQTSCRRACEEQTPAPYSAQIVVVPASGQGPMSIGRNERYDLSQLGRPVDVPHALLAELCDERARQDSQQRYCGVYADGTPAPGATPTPGRPVRRE